MSSPQKAGLASVLDSPVPMTVFAPISSAFDAMAEGHMQYLTSADVRDSDQSGHQGSGDVTRTSSLHQSDPKCFCSSGSAQNGGAAQEPHRPVHRGQCSSPRSASVPSPSTCSNVGSLPALKLEVYNAVSSPTILTMANQAVRVNVTDGVSVRNHPPCFSPSV